MPLFVTPGQLRRTSEFYRELAALLGAGIPVVQAFHTIRRQGPSRRFREAIDRTVRRIEAGTTLTEGLAAETPCIPAFDLALLRAGETSGRLVETCRSLAQHYDHRARLGSAFLTQLLYPCFLLHFAALVFPTERLVGLVLRGELHGFLTQKLAVLGPIYGLTLALVVTFQSSRGSIWREIVERVLHVVPLLGTARRELALARLAAALEALISAGIGIVESWELAAEASHSRVLAREVAGWRHRIETGEQPSDLVRASGKFPSTFVGLYYSGEQSGQLDQELMHLRDYYLDSGQRKLSRFVLAAGLAVSLGIMLAIAFFVVRFWVNYFNQLSNVIGP